MSKQTLAVLMVIHLMGCKLPGIHKTDSGESSPASNSKNATSTSGFKLNGCDVATLQTLQAMSVQVNSSVGAACAQVPASYITALATSTGASVGSATSSSILATTSTSLVSGPVTSIVGGTTVSVPGGLTSTTVGGNSTTTTTVISSASSPSGPLAVSGTFDAIDLNILINQCQGFIASGATVVSSTTTAAGGAASAAIQQEICAISTGNQSTNQQSACDTGSTTDKEKCFCQKLDKMAPVYANIPAAIGSLYDADFWMAKYLYLKNELCPSIQAGTNTNVGGLTFPDCRLQMMEAKNRVKTIYSNYVCIGNLPLPADTDKNTFCNYLNSSNFDPEQMTKPGNGLGTFPSMKTCATKYGMKYGKDAITTTPMPCSQAMTAGTTSGQNPTTEWLCNATCSIPTGSGTQSKSTSYPSICTTKADAIATFYADCKNKGGTVTTDLVCSNVERRAAPGYYCVDSGGPKVTPKLIESTSVSASNTYNIGLSVFFGTGPHGAISVNAPIESKTISVSYAGALNISGGTGGTSPIITMALCQADPNPPPICDIILPGSNVTCSMNLTADTSISGGIGELSLDFFGSGPSNLNAVANTCIQLTTLDMSNQCGRTPLAVLRDQCNAWYQGQLKAIENNPALIANLQSCMKNLMFLRDTVNECNTPFDCDSTLLNPAAAYACIPNFTSDGTGYDPVKFKARKCYKRRPVNDLCGTTPQTMNFPGGPSFSSVEIPGICSPGLTCSQPIPYGSPNRICKVADSRSPNDPSNATRILNGGGGPSIVCPFFPAGSAPTAISNLQLITANFNAITGGASLLTLQNLTSCAANTSLPQNVRDACTYWSITARFDSLDNAAQIAAGNDGNVAQSDLNAMTSQMPTIANICGRYRSQNPPPPSN